MFSWARFYESIFKLPSTDKPADDIIADDGKLDKWFQDWQRDQARAQAKQGQHQQPRPQEAPTPQLIDLSDVFGKGKGKDA